MGFWRFKNDPSPCFVGFRTPALLGRSELVGFTLMHSGNSKLYGIGLRLPVRRTKLWQAGETRIGIRNAVFG